MSARKTALDNMNGAMTKMVQDFKDTGKVGKASPKSIAAARRKALDEAFKGCK